MFLSNWARLYSNPTLAEKILEPVIASLGKPYRAQHPFFRHHIIVDFVLLEERVVIEVDGPSHESPVQRYKDLRRDLRLEEEGWRVVRFTNREVLAGVEPMDIYRRASSRRSLEELRAALRQYPEPPVRVSKPRGRKPKPDPKSAYRGKRPKKTEST